MADNKKVKLPQHLQLDSVSPATRLLEKRRLMYEVQKAFEDQKEEFQMKEKKFKLQEAELREKDILIHDAHCMDNTLQLKLALMEGPDFPIALGVIRDVEAPTYDDAVHEQIEEVSAKKKYHNFEELLMTNDTWEVK